MFQIKKAEVREAKVSTFILVFLKLILLILKTIGKIINYYII
jgi:hypothetical protein